METMIMQYKRRSVVFTEENCCRRAAANEAIRRIRVRGGLLRISEVHLDSDHPLILLSGTPPDVLLNAASGLHSRKIADDSDGRYVVRCTAFGCDWSWMSALPFTHVRSTPKPPAMPEPLPVNVVVHPMFGDRCAAELVAFLRRGERMAGKAS